jgi:hypothetical protein
LHLIWAISGTHCCHCKSQQLVLPSFSCPPLPALAFV